MGFGSRGPVWCGTLDFAAIEGAGFALAVGARSYTWMQNVEWLLGAAPPGLWPGLPNPGVPLASLPPNPLESTAAPAAAGETAAAAGETAAAAAGTAGTGG